jgi:hypothetical protein
MASDAGREKGLERVNAMHPLTGSLFQNGTSKIDVGTNLAQNLRQRW